jgi:uncharacterized protein (TIGR00251 family)
MESCRLKVKAVPGASRDEVAGYVGDRLKVRVKAPAEGGKANGAIRRVVAETPGVHARDIEIERGATSAEKMIVIHGVSEEEAMRKLGG